MVSYPVRYQVATMIFFSCYLSYMLRVDISIYTLDMVGRKNGTNKTTTYCEERQGVEGGTATKEKNDTRSEGPPFGRLQSFDWSKRTLSRLRAAYFWGYMIMNLPGGTLAERFGGRKILVISLALSSIFTFAIPPSAYLHWSVTYVCRMIIGSAAGVIFPCMQTLIAKWAPPKDKSKFTIGLLGGNLGTVVSFPLLGVICSSSNWVVAALFSGVFSGLGTILVFVIVRDTPESHPRITDAELSYIMEEQAGMIKKTKKLPPYKKILLNIPFWAYVFLQFGNVWGIYFLMTSQPQFMKDVLGFNPKENALLSALPHLARLLFGIAFGFIGNWVRKKDFCSLTVQRKVFTIISHVLPGVLLIFQSLNDCSVVVAVLSMTFSLGLNGAATVTSLINSQDLAPNFAGTIFGIANFIGSSSGLIIGEIVGGLTTGKTNKDLADAWKIIFVIGGGVYCCTAVVFFVFGSGKTQDYNEVQSKEDEGR